MLEFPLHDPRRIFASAIHSVAVVGTIHSHRNRWNPFHADNAMHPDPTGKSWICWFNLHPSGGRHRDGIYSFRFILNYNPRRCLKRLTWQYSGATLTATLCESPLGEIGANFTLHVLRPCAVCIRVEPTAGEASFICQSPGSFHPVSHSTSFQLNGFIWDNVDIFSKFDERASGRSFQRVSEDYWEVVVPLRRDGGIDFRRDGVYQFLISQNGDEDQGLSALNHATSDGSLLLVEGSGFGSSHGTVFHSSPTIQVTTDGLHVFSLRHHSRGYRLWVRGPEGQTVPFLNHLASSIQLLGTIYTDHSFDPNHPQATMVPDSSGTRFESNLSLAQGTYSINFAIARELFLDTMGLGCWLRHDGPGLRGVGWHGKPNEVNIGFHVRREGLYRFSYDCSNDQFAIDPLTPELQQPGILEPVLGIETLSLVGNFARPLESWSTESEQNLMANLGGSRFEKIVFLEASTPYEFKFVANRSNWHVVFSDYELDGYGMSYNAPYNPRPFDSELCELRCYGHLTTHGNPPPIRFIPDQSAAHRIRVDLSTGSYSVQPFSTPLSIQSPFAQAPTVKNCMNTHSCFEGQL